MSKWKTARGVGTAGGVTMRHAKALREVELMDRAEYEALLREHRDLSGVDTTEARARLAEISALLPAGPKEAAVRALLRLPAKPRAPKR